MDRHDVRTRAVHRVDQPIQDACAWLAIGLITYANWRFFGIPMVAVLLTGRTAQNAGAYALAVAVPLCMVLFPEFRHPRKWWEALVEAIKTHPWLTDVTLEYAVQDGGMALHPGALKYYQEIGLEIPAESM